MPVPNHHRDPDPGFTYQVPDASGRGFHGHLTFTDRYGAEVNVKPSSLASESAHWVFVSGGGVTGNDGALHLGIDHAMELIAGLARCVADNLIDSEGLYNDGKVQQELSNIASKALWVKDNTLWGDDLDDLDEDDNED